MIIIGKNSIYLKNNFEQLIKDFISKLKFVFFNIHKDGSLDLNSVRNQNQQYNE